MTTQINVPNQNLPIFIEACEKVQIIYHQIEARENDTRYELTYQMPAQLYYLGRGVGLEIGHRIHTETMDQLQYGK
jgi:hypothetical protein